MALKTKANISAIVAAILVIDSFEDLKRINEAARSQFDLLQRKQALNFRIGDRVQFMGNRRHPGIQRGVIESITNKKVKVRVGPIKWTVSPNLVAADTLAKKAA